MRCSEVTRENFSNCQLSSGITYLTKDQGRNAPPFKFTNEKRGALKVVAFDRSPPKLISLRFLKEIGAGPILWEA
jgi:hypothetical protein